MRLYNCPYKVQCQKCGRMVNLLTSKNNMLICLQCANIKYLKHDDRKPHSLKEIRKMQKRRKHFKTSRKIYAIHGITSICQG